MFHSKNRVNQKTINNQNKNREMNYFKIKL